MEVVGRDGYVVHGPAHAAGVEAVLPDPAAVPATGAGHDRHDRVPARAGTGGARPGQGEAWRFQIGWLSSGLSSKKGLLLLLVSDQS